MVDLINGDCIEEMQRLIDEGVQVDSVVTDPPYHLTSIVKRFGKENSAPAKYGTDGAYARASKGFMGKEWDGGDIAFRPETWELALKLLKPGGHLLAFSASRNYHRMAVAIEDAGFEIRDQLMWLYGSGFPKSHNISKSIDKAAGATRKVVGTKDTRSEYDGKTRKSKAINKGWRQAENRDDFIDMSKKDITVPATPEAQEWEGWGTALKPAHEPIVMARKPLSEKSIVDNVLKHATGGINIDGCRVDLSEGDDPRLGGKGTWKTKEMAKNVYGNYQGKESGSSELGRFPANVMHDGSEEVLSGFPHTKSGTLSPDMNVKESTGWSGGSKADRVKNTFIGSEGSAARFFYSPKVSKSERGNNNTHPTVKPVELMKYLCRLVTPKGGIVLDPFMGSGSTGLAAKDEGFDFIGIEREKEYFEICKSRIEKSSPLMEFFE